MSVFVVFKLKNNKNVVCCSEVPNCGFYINIFIFLIDSVL